MKKYILPGAMLLFLMFFLSSCFGTCKGEPREIVLEDDDVVIDINGETDDELDTGGEKTGDGKGGETSEVSFDESSQETSIGGTSSEGETVEKSYETSVGSVSESSSDDPCAGNISLTLEVHFAEYFDGVYRYTLDFSSPEFGDMEGTFAGGVQNTIRLFSPACGGKATLSIFNDFDGDGSWSPVLEAKTTRNIEISPSDIVSAVDLFLPFTTMTSYPRHAIVYLNPDANTSDEFITSLALADLVVIDHSTVENFPSSFVQKLRRANRENQILIYYDPTSVYDLPRSSLDIQKYNYLRDTLGFIDGIGSVSGYMPGVWRDKYVTQLQYWPGSNMVNMTSHVKAIGSDFFSQWAFMHAAYFEQLARNLGVNGMFLDNMLWTYHHIPLANENDVSALDANYDRIENELVPVGEGFYQIDRDLQEGLHEFLGFMRQHFPGPILGNGSNPEYVSELDGVYFENVQDWGRTYQLFEQTVPEGEEKISVWNNVIEDDSQIQECRIGVLSATILGGYHSCENFLHDGFYWVDEYAFSLGRRVGDIVWRNNVNLSIHEFGIVLYNSTLSAQRLYFSRSMQTFFGTQRADLNHGGVITNITLPAQEGIMLKYYP